MTEQLLKLINALVSLKKKRMAAEFASSNPLDHNVWGVMLGRCQKFTPNPTNIAELKTALLSIWNDLPQEFVDKAIPSRVGG